MRGWIYALLCSVVFAVGGCCPVWAGSYVLEPVDLSEDEILAQANAIDDWDEWQEFWAQYENEDGDIVLASPSSLATPSIMPMSNYGEPYDGSMSSSVVQYFKDVVEKLPYGVHYVLFRPDRYSYRLVFADDLTYTNGVFRSSDAQYVEYYSYSSSTWTQGSEGSFSLTPQNLLVYSDLGNYPVLLEGVKNYEFKALLFCVVVFGLITLLRPMFSPGRYSI